MVIVIVCTDFRLQPLDLKPLLPAMANKVSDEEDDNVPSCASDPWETEAEFGPANADESDAWAQRLFAQVKDAGKIHHVMNQLSHGALLTTDYSGQPIMNHELKDLSGASPVLHVPLATVSCANPERKQ